MTTANVFVQLDIEAAVAACHEDPDPGLWTRRQAGARMSNIRLLVRRWKDLNAVSGTETMDTWVGAGLWGLGVALAIIVVGGMIGASKIGAMAFVYGALPGLLLGLAVSYARFVAMVWSETYIEVMVDEHFSDLGEEAEATDSVVAFLPRLGFWLRPDIIDGNRGQTGLRDRRARIRMRAPFGTSIHDFRRAADFWALPPNSYSLEPAPNMTLYSLIMLVRQAARLYREKGVPASDPPGDRLLHGPWPFIIFIAGLIGAVLIYTS